MNRLRLIEPFFRADPADLYRFQLPKEFVNLLLNVKAARLAAAWVKRLEGLRRLEGFALPTWRPLGAPFHVGYPVSRARMHRRFHSERYRRDSHVQDLGAADRGSRSGYSMFQSLRMSLRRSWHDPPLYARGEGVFEGLVAALGAFSRGARRSPRLEWGVFRLEGGRYLVRRGTPHSVPRRTDHASYCCIHSHPNSTAFPSGADLLQAGGRMQLVHSPGNPLVGFHDDLIERGLSLVVPLGARRFRVLHWMDWGKMEWGRPDGTHWLSACQIDLEMAPGFKRIRCDVTPLLPRQPSGWRHHGRIWPPTDFLLPPSRRQKI